MKTKTLTLVDILLTALAISISIGLLSGCGDGGDDMPKPPVTNEPSGGSNSGSSGAGSESSEDLEITTESLVGVWKGSPVSSEADGFVLHEDGWGYLYSGLEDNMLRIFMWQLRKGDDGIPRIFINQFGASVGLIVKNLEANSCDMGSVKVTRVSGATKSPMSVFFPGAYACAEYRENYVFCTDGTGYSYADSPEKPETYLKWKIEPTPEDEDLYNINLYNENGRLYNSLFLLGIMNDRLRVVDYESGKRVEMPKHRGFVAPATAHDKVVEVEAADITGCWYYFSTNRKYMYEYYFYEDGSGYYDETYYGKNIAVKRYWFHWNCRGNKVSINYDSKASAEYTYSVEGKSLTWVNEKNGKSETFKYSAVTTKEPYGQRPFANNYIYDKIRGYYYQLNKAEEACDHAAPGEKGNWKFLRFFGDNDLIEPTGGYIFYVTPYYDGIDAYWSEGTYMMLYNNNYYTYGAVLRCGNNMFDISRSDKLTVKKSGNIRQYDYKGRDVEIHFVGTIK